MTFEFAVKEAQRRTKELGTEHHVVYITSDLLENDEYIITTYIPNGYGATCSVFPVGIMNTIIGSS